MSRRCIPLRNAFIAASLVAQPVVADTILDETYTASELFSLAAFPSRTPSLTMGNTRLEFPAGLDDFEVLFVLPLLPANTLSPSEPATISLTLDLALLAANNDLAVGLSDGENFVSVKRSAAFVPESYWVEAAFTTPRMQSLQFTSSETLGTGAEVFTMTFTLGASTSVDATIGAGSDSRVFSRTLNRENPLSLVFISMQNPEAAQGIDSASVTIAQVPEPTGAFLLLAGVSALTFRRSRAKA